MIDKAQNSTTSDSVEVTRVGGPDDSRAGSTDARVGGPDDSRVAPAQEQTRSAAAPEKK